MTPEEMQARIAANLKSIQDAQAAAKTVVGDSAKKAADDDKDEMKGAKGDAYEKGQGLAIKAHKAVKAMHEHAMGNENVEKSHKEACAKALTAMGGACKAWGGPAAEEAEATDSKQEGGEKALYGEAMKALGAMQAKLDMIEKGAYQPRGAGAGAAVATAVKGAAADGEAEAFKMPSKAEMAKLSDDERKELALKSLAIDKALPMAADAFKFTGNEVLKAQRALAESEIPAAALAR